MQWGNLIRRSKTITSIALLTHWRYCSLTLKPLISATTQRTHDAITTLSWRQNDVMMTLLLRHVSAGYPPEPSQYGPVQIWWWCRLDGSSAVVQHGCWWWLVAAPGGSGTRRFPPLCPAVHTETTCCHSHWAVWKTEINHWIHYFIMEILKLVWWHLYTERTTVKSLI